MIFLPYVPLYHFLDLSKFCSLRPVKGLKCLEYHTFCVSVILILHVMVISNVLQLNNNDNHLDSYSENLPLPRQITDVRWLYIGVYFWLNSQFFLLCSVFLYFFDIFKANFCAIDSQNLAELYFFIVL